MRKVLLGFFVLAAASTAKAALVTYTLKLNEGPTGQVQPNSFVVYATVSQGDNFGLFGYGVDMKLPSEGGPTTLTITQRSPVGHWSIDDGDPNWNPDASYPNKVGGFGLFRGISPSGAVAGNQDISQYDPVKGDGTNPGGSELMILRGVGQTAGSMNNLVPGKSMGLDGTNSVPWKPYTRDGSPLSDLAYGTPPNPAGDPRVLAPGTVRLFSGTWTGSIPPEIQSTVDTKAGVWRTNATSGPEAIQVEVAQVAIQVCCPPPDIFSRFTLDASGQVGTNQAVGGGIAVSGANGSYISEVDDLIANTAIGNAPITSIGAEAGSIYVMARLIGTQAQIAAFLSDVTADVDATDSQFAPLHVAYDSQFGGGGFNALFKFANAGNNRFINWDGTTAGITIDKLAVVPEPAALSVLGLALLASRRRRQDSKIIRKISLCRIY